MHTRSGGMDVTGSEGPILSIEDWRRVTDRLAERWPVLTTAELEATRGRTEMIAGLLEAKISFAQRLADEALGRPLMLGRAETPARRWLRVPGVIARLVYARPL